MTGCELQCLNITFHYIQILCMEFCLQTALKNKAWCQFIMTYLLCDFSVTQQNAIIAIPCNLQTCWLRFLKEQKVHMNQLYRFVSIWIHFLIPGQTEKWTTSGQGIAAMVGACSRVCKRCSKVFGSDERKAWRYLHGKFWLTAQKIALSFMVMRLFRGRWESDGVSENIKVK